MTQVTGLWLLAMVVVIPAIISGVFLAIDGLAKLARLASRKGKEAA